MGQVVESRIIAPAGSRWETLLLVGASAALLLFTGLYALFFGRPETGQELADWQISAYRDLGEADQAIHGQLMTAIEEIRLFHRFEDRWPSPAGLREAFVPPFLEDDSWRRLGTLQWRLLEAAPRDAAGQSVYYGAGGDLQGQGAWLLIFDHRHAGGEQLSETSLWRHRDADAAPPPNMTSGALVQSGWRQVIPYRGGDEVERINAG